MDKKAQYVFDRMQERIVDLDNSVDQTRLYLQNNPGCDPQTEMFLIQRTGYAKLEMNFLEEMQNTLKSKAD